MKYTVSGVVTISMYTEVEADSPEEAKEIANSRSACGLIDPQQMGDYVSECWFHSGEIDGVVEAISAEAE